MGYIGAINVGIMEKNMATVLMGYKLGGLPALDWTIRGIQEDPKIISIIPYSHYYRVGGPPKLYMGFRARGRRPASYARMAVKADFAWCLSLRMLSLYAKTLSLARVFDSKLETHQKTLSLFCCFSLPLSRSLLPPLFLSSLSLSLSPLLVVRVE